MTAELNFLITGAGEVTDEVRRRGFSRFLDLAQHVSQLPYGRPTCIEDIAAVLTQQRGTCSFKHRLLAAVAQDCGHHEIKLVVGLYAMSEENTPGVGAVLQSSGVFSIPEAHCYIRVGNRRYDFTGLKKGSASPFESLIAEELVSPKTVLGEKNRLHDAAIRRWAEEVGLSVEQAWSLREACIQALTSVA